MPPKKQVSSVKALADEWTDASMPILFGQMFPKEYSDIEKKIDEKNKKGQSVIVTLIASFIKPLVADLLKYINVKELYDGLVDIAKYIGADDLVQDDIENIYKYTPKRVSAENKKILTKRIIEKTIAVPKTSSRNIDVQKELEDARKMIEDMTKSTYERKSTERFNQRATGNKYLSPIQMAMPPMRNKYSMEDIDEDLYVPSSKVSYGSPDPTPLMFSFTQPVLRDFQALRPQPSMYNKIREQFRPIDVEEPILQSPRRPPSVRPSAVPKLPKFSEITAKDLKEKLKALGLASSGAKDKLYGRYQMALGNERQYEKRVPGEDFTNYKKISVKDLKETLVAVGLSPKGKKDELVARLKAYRAA